MGGTPVNVVRIRAEPTGVSALPSWSLDPSCWSQAEQHFQPSSYSDITELGTELVDFEDESH